jgi:hypothetical protein
MRFGHDLDKSNRHIGCCAMVVNGRRQVLNERKRMRCGDHTLSDRDDKNTKIHTTGGIPRWSPTLVLVARFSAYVWQSGRSSWTSLPN